MAVKSIQLFFVAVTIEWRSFLCGGGSGRFHSLYLIILVGLPSGAQVPVLSLIVWIHATICMANAWHLGSESTESFLTGSIPRSYREILIMSTQNPTEVISGSYFQESVPRISL